MKKFKPVVGGLMFATVALLAATGCKPVDNGGVVTTPTAGSTATTPADPGASPSASPATPPKPEPGQPGPAGPKSKADLAVYVGNDSNALCTFEQMIGRPVDGILTYTGERDWNDHNADYALGLWANNNRPIYFSVPLLVEGASLSQASKGSYNKEYAENATKILAKSKPNKNGEYWVRTAWEYNGDWMRWAVKDKSGRQLASPDEFKGAFQQFVTAFRSVPGGEKFRFEWNNNILDDKKLSDPSALADPEKYYPGNAYVDAIGMDFYWNKSWDPTDPNKAWNRMLYGGTNRKAGDPEGRGLEWAANYAAANKKRIALSEYGVNVDNAGPYFESLKKWIDSHDVVHYAYWDSNSAFPGKLSGNTAYPNAAKAFVNTFAAQKSARESAQCGKFDAAGKKIG